MSDRPQPGREVAVVTLLRADIGLVVVAVVLPQPWALVAFALGSCLNAGVAIFMAWEMYRG